MQREPPDYCIQDNAAMAQTGADLSVALHEDDELRHLDGSSRIDVQLFHHLFCLGQCDLHSQGAHGAHQLWRVG